MRWKRRMLLGALAVLVPALAGCEAGYNAPTLEYHPAAFGAYASKNGISISNAFVLGPPLGAAVRPAAGPASSSRSLRRTGTSWSRPAPRAPRPPCRSSADRSTCRPQRWST